MIPSNYLYFSTYKLISFLKEHTHTLIMSTLVCVVSAREQGLTFFNDCMTFAYHKKTGRYKNSTQLSRQAPLYGPNCYLLL